MPNIKFVQSFSNSKNKKMGQQSSFRRFGRYPFETLIFFSLGEMDFVTKRKISAERNEILEKSVN